MNENLQVKINLLVKCNSISIIRLCKSQYPEVYFYTFKASCEALGPGPSQISNSKRTKAEVSIQKLKISDQFKTNF